MHSGTNIDGGLRARAHREFAAYPRQFWLLAGGAFLLLTGIDMCFPFETSYLTTRFGVSMTALGFILGLPLLAAVPLYIAGGAFTDRYGRRPAMAVAIVVVSLLYVVFAGADRLWPIAVAVALEAAFGWSLYLTGSNAMVADLIAVERRAEAYSITRVAQHIGMVVGPLAAALLLAAGFSYRWLFVGGAVICAAYVVLMLLTFKETKPQVRHHEPLGRTLSDYRSVLKDRGFLAFCLLALLPLFGFGQIWVTLPIALREQHGVTPQAWAWLLTFYALTVAVLQYPIIRLLRRRNLIMVVAAASLFVGSGMLGVVTAPPGALTFFFIFCVSLGVMLLIPVAPTVAAEFAPVPLRGRYMGVWTLTQQSGYALGPLCGGVALDTLGPVGGGAVTALCGLAGAAGFCSLAFVLRASARRRREASRVVAQHAFAEPAPTEPPAVRG